MRKQLQKSGLIMASLLLASQSWSQCAQITCPPNATITADSGSCSAVYTYPTPQGIDMCNSFSDTISFSGVINSWSVPAGITEVTIEARGAEGSNNTSSTVPAGLGAIMIGDFTVTPGQTLSILVGQQYSSTSGNGGGGGTFVVDALNNPLIVAGGGGGSSETVDSPDKHGQITTTGGTGAGGGGLGGSNGNGGSIGATFASGAGGGFLTDGQTGWTANTGGLAYLNGGSGGTANGNAQGGFGGGGSGSSYVVGGGGGGYSGGGAGSNSQGAGVGGGGGSINNGTNQNNTAGANSGNGMVIISYSTPAPTSMLYGQASGSSFPVGTTSQTYVTYVSASDTAYCMFDVTVVDTIAPTISVPNNVTSCDSLVTGIDATAADICGAAIVTYTLSGATTGSGTGSASGSAFNVGTTTVSYVATDVSGNTSSASLDVTVLPLPSVTLDPFSMDTLCVNSAAVSLPTGSPASGVYSGAGVVGSNFDPATAGVGNQTVVYTYTDTNGCQNSASSSIYIDGCASLNELGGGDHFNVYPNPGNGTFNLVYSNKTGEVVNIQVTDAQGRVVYTNSTSSTSIEEVIDITNSANGVYLVELSTSTYKLMKQLIKH